MVLKFTERGLDAGAVPEPLPDGWIKGRNLSYGTFNRNTLAVVLEDT
jgi:hypothetical protein